MNNTIKSAADAAVVATKIPAKETAKQPTAKQAEAKQKTSEKAKAAADEATKEVAEHPMLSEEDAAPAKAKEDASSFRALVLIGVAAAFCAAFTPHMTKLSVANKLAEVNHPVAVPPQWMPVLLAAGALQPSPPPPPPLVPPCAYLIDFALLLDESGSMKKPLPNGSMEGPGGLKAFAKELVKQYSLGADAARFSVVSFAENATDRKSVV